MNKPAWFFGTTSLLLGALCVSLARQPPAHGAQATVQGSQDEILQAQLAQARADRDRLETVVSSLRAAAGSVAPAPPRSAAVGNAPPPPLATRFDLSPASRRLMVQHQNGKMFRQLGLSPAEVESLLDVLVAQQERAAEGRSGPLFAGSDPEWRASNRAEVAAVIGEEPAAQLEDWQTRALARFELRRLRDQLEDSGEPLSDAQLKRINESMRAQPQVPPPAHQKDDAPEAIMERFKAWRKDQREQLRGQVSSVLEPRQLERYDEIESISREFEKAMPQRFPPMPAPSSAGQAAPHPLP